MIRRLRRLLAKGREQVPALFLGISDEALFVAFYEGPVSKRRPEERRSSSRDTVLRRLLAAMWNAGVPGMDVSSPEGEEAGEAGSAKQRGGNVSTAGEQTVPVAVHELPEELRHGGYTAQPRLLGELVRERCGEALSEGLACFWVLGGSRLFSKLLRIPPGDRKEVARAASWEGKRYIPFTEECVDGAVTLDSGGDGALRPVLYCAAEKAVAEALSLAAEAAGLVPGGIYPASLPVPGVAAGGKSGEAGSSEDAGTPEGGTEVRRLDLRAGERRGETIPLWKVYRGIALALVVVALLGLAGTEVLLYRDRKALESQSRTLAETEIWQTRKQSWEKQRKALEKCVNLRETLAESSLKWYDLIDTVGKIIPEGCWLIEGKQLSGGEYRKYRKMLPDSGAPQAVTKPAAQKSGEAKAAASGRKSGSGKKSVTGRKPGGTPGGAVLLRGRTLSLDELLLFRKELKNAPAIREAIILHTGRGQGKDRDGAFSYEILLLPEGGGDRG